MEAVTNKRVELLPKASSFVVHGYAGQTSRFVKIHPKYACTCPGRTMRWHIIAVKISVWHSDIRTKRNPNISGFRKRKWDSDSVRPKRRKKPTLADFDNSSSIPPSNMKQYKKVFFTKQNVKVT